MATTDLRVGGSNELPISSSPGIVTQVKTIDFSVNTAGDGDIFNVFHVPVNTWVLEVMVSVDTAEGHTATIEVGDATTIAQYHTGLSINAATSTVSAATAWKFYSVANDIRIETNHAATGAAKITVRAVMLRVTE